MKLEGKNAIYEALNSQVKLNKVLILSTNKDEFTNKIISLLNKKKCALRTCCKRDFRQAK